MSTTFESDWENTRLKERIEELERTWLSPEAYETLMRERQEILHELNEPVRLSECQQLEKERDQLREQVKMLRDEVTRCRDWFETQAKVTSKGGPSSWELMLLRDERDAAEEALAATEPKL